MLIALRTLRVTQHLCAGLLVIVVVELDLARPEATRADPFGKVLLVALELARRRPQRNRVKTRYRAMRRLGIRQHQDVLSTLMLEEIINAVLLHQTADEIEISFPILNAVFELRTRRFFVQFRFVVGETAVVEYFLDNVGSRHILKFAGIGRWA